MSDGTSSKILLKLFSGFDGIGLDAIARLADTFGQYVPSVDEPCCPNTRVRNREVCPAPCIRLCPTRAISVADSIAIDQSKCISCNICATSCPHGVFDPTAPPDSVHFDAILAARKDGKQNIRFSCSRCAGRYGKPPARKSRGVETIVLPCLGSLSEILPLYASLLDCAVSIDPCPADCSFKQGRECYEQAMKRIETVLQCFGAQQSDLKNTVAREEPSGLDRRAFLLSAGEEIMKSLFDSEERQSGGPILQPYHQSLPRRRMDLLALALKRPMSPMIVEFRSYPILKISVKPADCDLCEICSKLCPTGALRYLEESNRGSISFLLGKCTGCRLCVEACPKKCITHDNADLGKIGSDWLVLVDKGLSRCRVCDFRILQDSSLTADGTCPLCKKRTNLIPAQ